MRGDSTRIVRPLFQEGEGGLTPTSPLQLEIGVIDPRNAQRLNRLWHSVLPETFLGNIAGAGLHSVCYAAEYDGLYYAVAIWTDPIAANRMRPEDARISIELRRFAIASDAPKNTASRMLAVMRRLVFKRFPDITRLISYQAEEHHLGTIYKAAGWEKSDKKSKSAKWHGNVDALQTTSTKIKWTLNRR